VGGRASTLADGPFAGLERGAHWVHGGESNYITAPLLAYFGLELKVVGGNEAFEGAPELFDVLEGDTVLAGDAVAKGFQDFREVQKRLDAFVQQRVTPCAEDACRGTDLPMQAAWDAAAGASPSPLLELLGRLQYEQDEGAELSALSARVDDLADYTEFYPKHSRGDASIVGGYSALVAKMADGVRIEPGRAVAVEHTDDGVTVHTDDGAFHGTHAVLTLPAAKLLGLAITPPLPAWKVNAVSRIPLGNVAKLFVRLAAPLPRRKLYGLARTGNSSAIQFCVHAGFEDPRHADKLECFLSGKVLRSVKQLQPEALRRTVEAELAGLGVAVVDTLVHDWADAATVGGAWSFPPVGTLERDFTAYGTAVGRLHFAGEGACRLLYGNVHAALASGARAAFEVLPDGATAGDWPLAQKGVRTACDAAGDAVIV